MAAGADVIDCKDPSSGALGALAPGVITEIVTAIAGRRPVSATIGDLPADSGIMCTAAIAIATTGANIVKAGFFGDCDPRPAIAALGRTDLKGARLVAVLMADRAPDFTLLTALAAAGFAGVMLDTADKSAGALPGVIAPDRLRAFIGDARDSGLFAGLAGSLRRAHIAGLVNLQPDLIGFRGALCRDGRGSALDAARVKAVRDAIDAAVEARDRVESSVA